VNFVDRVVVIVGAGAHGREVEEYLHDLPDAPRLLGFLDEIKPQGPHGESQVLGSFEAAKVLLSEYNEVFYITAAGDNLLRRKLAVSAEEAGLTPYTLRHFSAVVGRDCDIGAGGCLAPNTVLTRNVALGRHCIVNVGTTVSHDCLIGDFVNLNPGVTVCGNVEIGEDCYIGAGATVIDKVSIGANTVVGAGAVVIDDLPSGVLALGVPARVARELYPKPRLV
jgi:acetyltransferase EpsM